MDNLRISLAAARVNAGLKQGDVAKALRVSKTTVLSWEKGYSAPSIAKARALSDLYNMPLDNIFLPSESN